MAFTDAGGWKPEDDGVANRIAKITSSSGDYMRQARASGLKTANRRGLGNSSMAAEASQAAAISAAAPIAGQEAGQIANKNQAVLEGGIRTDQLQKQLAAAEREMLARSVTDLTGQRYNAFAATLNNSDIPGNVRADVQRSINDQNTSAMNYLQNLYGVSLDGRTPTVAGAQGTNPVPGTQVQAGTIDAGAPLPPGYVRAPNGQVFYVGTGGLGGAGSGGIAPIRIGY